MELFKGLSSMTHNQKIPQISVIMPSFNAEKYIGESIESILRQTFNRFELIINDDNSTDATWDIICKYAVQDSRIKLFQNESTLGIAGNRNRGLRLARSEYIAWQDADDISMPKRLEKQFRFMQENTDVAIVGAFLEFFDDSGTLNRRTYDTTDGPLRRKIFRFSPVAQPVAMIRKKCLDAVGEYDLRYPPAEDIDMSFRLGERYRFANIPEVLLQYRQHAASATFSKLKTIEINTIEIRKRYFKHPSYYATIFDRIYNFLQYVSIYTLSPEFKIWLFNKLRNV